MTSDIGRADQQLSIVRPNANTPRLVPDDSPTGFGPGTVITNRNMGMKKTAHITSLEDCWTILTPQRLPVVGEYFRTILTRIKSANQPTGSIYGDRHLRRLLWYLLGGTRGGPNRAQIIKVLQKRPSNSNQLAETLGVDYKTIQHHVRVLEENGLIAPSEKGVYGAVLFLTPKMEEALPILDEIWSRIGRTEIKKRGQE